MFSQYEQLPSSVTVTTTAETVALTTQPVSAAIEITPQGRVIRGYLNITIGTAGATLSVRCRQGSVSGTQVGSTDVQTVTATDLYQVPFSFLDTSDATLYGGFVYVITVQVASASGNSTVNDGAVEIFVPDPGGSIN